MNNEIISCKKQAFCNNLSPPYALVVTSDLANAALLRAGALSLQKHLVKETESAQMQTQTQIQIWVPPGCLLVPADASWEPPGCLLEPWVSPGASWLPPPDCLLLAVSSWLPPPGCLLNDDSFTLWFLVHKSSHVVPPWLLLHHWKLQQLEWAI